MKKYSEMSKTELQSELNSLKAEYESLKNLGLNLNMARGKPGLEQLNLVNQMNEINISNEQYNLDGVETRNYGNLEGIPAARKLFADILDTSPENIFVGGNASLQLMYDIISKAYTHGLANSPKPWCKEEKIKWLCPAPGYDRHFKITESFGFELVTVKMLPDGPDMNAVEELVKDSSVKGIWCVPKYSNPDGIVYSENTIKRLASLKPAAPDFTVMWDNAYCIHEFAGDCVPFPDILSECEKAGNPDIVFEFASTSKVTFPGAGISCFVTSLKNLEYIKKLIGIQTIGFDKVNQLRHVLFLKDKANTLNLMKKHAAILKPKFDCVLDNLNKEIKPLDFAKWTEPKGGYFVSLYTLSGCAKRTWQLAKEAGLTMTGAGATYPYGIDPDDSNMRIAPSFPSVEELEQAMKLYCVCLKLAAAEKLVGEI